MIQSTNHPIFSNKNLVGIIFDYLNLNETVKLMEVSKTIYY